MHIKCTPFELHLPSQVAFPGFTAKALDDFVHHVRLDTSNVSHLFASEAALIQQYATPFITSINVEFRVSSQANACMTASPFLGVGPSVCVPLAYPCSFFLPAIQSTATSLCRPQDKSSLAAASLLCSPRPIAAVYAPARARLLPSPSPDYVYQGFAMVLAFDEPFDLVNDCTDARYSCLLALGVGGQVQSGSAQQLDAEGKLFQVRTCNCFLFLNGLSVELAGLACSCSLRLACVLADLLTSSCGHRSRLMCPGKAAWTLC